MAEAPDESLRVFVGMGSNLGDRAGNLLAGVRGILGAGLPVARLSSVYETEPVGVTDEQPPFLNMVAELRGALPAPEQLLARLLRIEYAAGRRRTAGASGARTLDLDLLAYGGERRETEFLTLPHPRLHLRRFALVPLAELACDFTHPTLHRTFGELLAALDDPSSVARWKPKAGMKAGG